jgi:hypothetical protein
MQGERTFQPTAQMATGVPRGSGKRSVSSERTARRGNRRKAAYLGNVFREAPGVVTHRVRPTCDPFALLFPFSPLSIYARRPFLERAL